MKATVLVIEDEPKSQDALREVCAREGWSCTCVTTGEAGITALRTGQFDVALVDVGLPGELDGYEVCRHIREKYPDMIVIFVTGRDEVIRGLSQDPNDYITKPFNPTELVLRIEIHLRRKRIYGEIVQLGHRTVNLVSGDIAEAGVRVGELKEMELKVFTYLARNKGKYCSKNEILDNVWGVDVARELNSVEQVVSSLRKQLGEAFIHTKYGVGYRLMLDPNDDMKK